MSPSSSIADAVVCRPQELLHPHRLDLIVKYLLFRDLIDGVDRGARDRYECHVSRRTAGFEHTKRTPAAYVEAATELLHGLRTHGFDETRPVPVSGDGGMPLDGAHRIAACLALDIPVAIETDSTRSSPVWDHQWFRSAGFHQEDLDTLVRTYATLSARPVVFIFWGATHRHWDAMHAAVTARAHVIGSTDIAFDHAELRTVVDDVYAWWCGPLTNSRIRQKVELLSAAVPSVRVVVAEAPRQTEDLKTFAAAIKRELRLMAGRDEHDFWDTVHGSDTAAEARYLVDLFFTANYRRVLRMRSAFEPRPQFLEWLHRYRDTLQRLELPLDDACVVGSAVLEAIGLRESTDIDCIVGRREPRFHHGVVQLGDGVDLVTKGYHRRADGGPTFTDGEAIADPSLHFWMRGLKFANPEIVIDRKRQHGRPKDMADVELWHARMAPHLGVRTITARQMFWTRAALDVVRVATLRRDGERYASKGVETIWGGALSVPVFVGLPYIPSPPALDSLPVSCFLDVDPRATLIGYGVDPVALMDAADREWGPARGSGHAFRRVRGLAWVARWMRGWLRELELSAVHAPENDTYSLLLRCLAGASGVAVVADRDMAQIRPARGFTSQADEACRLATEPLRFFEAIAMQTAAEPAMHDDASSSITVAPLREDGIRTVSPMLRETVRLLTARGARVLYCGGADAALIADMQSDGFDVCCVDADAAADVCSAAAVATTGDAISTGLPHADTHFATTVVGPELLEALDGERLVGVLLEIGRVTGGSIVLDTSMAGDAGAGRSRTWWEERCLVAGLRRHPRLFAFVDYEALEDEPAGAPIVMQTLPPAALLKHPLASLRAERDLHMDMLRETGRRSDAHLARYEWARAWIRPGDVVVDAACGLGYGTALMWDGTDAVSVTGLDISESAIAYARDCFVPGRPGVRFRAADVETWDGWADNSVDCIVSFETLEHLVDPDRFIAGVRRVLRPGGRFLCSIPNMWVDDTGNDPNPYHLHVFDLERLVDTVAKGLLVDDAFAQSAGGHGARFDPRRLLRPLGWPTRDALLEASAEWWLLCGIKDPLADGMTDEVRAGARGDLDASHAAIRSLLLAPGHVRSAEVRDDIATRWLEASGADSVDADAARCILAAQALERGDSHGPHAVEPRRHTAPWQAALQFIAAQRQRTRGDYTPARVTAERAALVAIMRRVALPDGLPVRTTQRVGIFGTGAAAMKVWAALAPFDNLDVAWFADNDERRQGQTLLWLHVIAPSAIPSQLYDAVIIGSMSRAPIEAQLLSLGVPAARIVTADVDRPVDALRNELARRPALQLREHLVRSS